MEFIKDFKTQEYPGVPMRSQALEREKRQAGVRGAVTTEPQVKVVQP